MAVRLMATPRRPPAQRTAFEQQLRDEFVAVMRRRRAAGLSRREAARAPLVGLALSGGGVRSATFSFGLLRGLASQGLLSRVDLLSTVSGGGYIGAMFGRLAAAVGIREAERQLAASPAPVLEWLRRNGRYLTPAGSRDIGIAIVTYARAALAIHGELLFALLPFALLVVLPHLLQHTYRPLDPDGWEWWDTLWWPLAALFACLTMPGTMAAYWIARDGRDPKERRPPVSPGDVVFLLLMVLAAAITASGIGAVHDGVGPQPFMAAAFASTAVGIAFALQRLRFGNESRALAVARVRNHATYLLRALAVVTLGLFLVGLVDHASWWLLLNASSDRAWLWGGLGLGGAAAIVLRTLAGSLQQLVEEAARHARGWGPRLLHLTGLAAAAFLLLGGVLLVQWLVFAPQPIELLQPWPAWLRWTLLALLSAAWWAIGAHHDSMPNASSLHSFYRERITRAYLAVGNPNRGLAMATVMPADRDARNVTEVVRGDDIALRQYRPDRRGGPLHLVNTCLNQTKDDASGLYNADRKGTLVTVSAQGLEIGARDFVRWAGSHDAGTLGKWVAVSGAAAAPGAGSYTSRGWALLLFFLGVRLGHWIPSPEGRPAPRGFVGFAWRRLVKPAMLFAEATATYVGRARPWWYLSDGGHFENTAVYALLKRECDFIILSDASADGQYRFGDIENLVRKARIDLDAEIEFYPRGEAATLFTLAGSDLNVLSPEELVDNTSQRGVMLARIRYRASATGGDEHHGTLLVVKPNLYSSLDVDLLAYAQRNPTFPHESTGDQSFDEAQWESYHRLGEDIGEALHETWLAQLPGWRRRAIHRIVAPARLRRPPAAVPADAAPVREPAWRSGVKAGAIGTTIGLGASGTLLLSLWQVQDTVQRNEAARQTEIRTLFTEVSRELRDLDGRCPKVGDHTVVQLATLRELGDARSLQPIEQQSIARLVEHVQSECRRADDPGPTCGEAARRLQEGLCVAASKQLASTEPLSYWRPSRRPADDVRTLAAAWAVLSGSLTGEPTAVALRGGQTAGTAGASGSAAAGPSSQPDPLQSSTGSAPKPTATEPSAVDTTVAVGVPPVMPVPAPLPTAPATSAIAMRPPSADERLWQACWVDRRPARVYVQVYDEGSRDAANRLRDALVAAGGGHLVVAPIENVSRTAEARQQRKPVPWLQPTLIVHDPKMASCARELAAPVGQAWPQGGRTWITELPSGLKGQPHVIELWLPVWTSAAGARVAEAKQGASGR